jgi:hypothetical protein
MMHYLRRQGRRVFVIIVGIQLLTSFGAIALLTRMGPAIARVAEENVESLTAVESMLLALAESPDPNGEGRGAFLAALDAADANVTESSEPEILAAIRESADLALTGETAARSLVFQQLRQLADTNRDALRRSDREARRLAEAGAWSVAVLACLGFLFVLYVAGRADRQFVIPILEVSRTLHAAGQGDRFRRCSLRSSSPEIREIAEGVNRLLDESSTRAL